MSSEVGIVYLEIPLAVIVCIIYICVGLAIHHYKETYGHSPWIHESTISCLFGLVVGGLIKFHTGIAVTFDNTLFFYLVLPPIIFSAGFSLKRKRFFQYIHQIMFFGVVGTIIDVLLIAVGAVMYSKLSGNSAVELSWNQSLLFASVLAGSDEVSAMSLIRIKDFPRMGALIFGEGVINDALSIVLFKTFLPLYNQEMLVADAAAGGVEAMEALSHTALVATQSWYSSGFMILGSIAFQILSSWVIGMGCGLVNAYIMKSFTFTKKFPISQTALVLLFGYLAYTLAEATGVSGILTLFIVAITLAHYSWYSLSNAAKIATRISFAGMSDIAEGFAFSYVGLSLWGFSLSEFDFVFAFYMLAVVMLARMVVIFGLFALCRRFFQSFDIPVGEQVGFALGGIVRGCLCWAQILQVKGFPVLVTSTLIVVMTTLIAGGVLLPMIIPLLGLRPLGGKGGLLSLNLLAINASRMESGDGRGQQDHTAHLSCENGMSPETTQDDMHLTHMQQLNQTQYANRSQLGLSILPPQSPEHYQGGGAKTMPSDETAFSSAVEGDEPLVTLSSLIYIQWIRLDEKVLKPWFGGSVTDPYRGQLLHDTANVSIYSIGKRTPGSAAARSRSYRPSFSDGTDDRRAHTPQSHRVGEEQQYLNQSLYRDIDFSAEDESSRMSFTPGDRGDGNDEGEPFSGAFDDVSQISHELNFLAEDVQLDDGSDIVLDGDVSICSISSPVRSSAQKLPRPYKQLRWGSDGRHLPSATISPISSSAYLAGSGVLSVDTTPQKQQQRMFFEVRDSSGADGDSAALGELSAIKTGSRPNYGGSDGNT